MKHFRRDIERVFCYCQDLKMSQLEYFLKSNKWGEGGRKSGIRMFWVENYLKTNKQGGTSIRDLRPGEFKQKVKTDKIHQTLQSHICNRNRVYGQQNHKYQNPIVNTELLKQSITYQRPRVWNNLKSKLKNKD